MFETAPAQNRQELQLPFGPETGDELRFLREQARKYTDHLEKRIKDLEISLSGNTHGSASTTVPLYNRDRYDGPPFHAINEPEARQLNRAPTWEPPSQSEVNATNNAAEPQDEAAENEERQYKIVYRQQNDDGLYDRISEVEYFAKDDDKRDPGSTLAFEYKKFKAKKGSDELILPEVVIFARLSSLLRKLLPHYPDPEHELDTEEPWFESPFPMFVLNWDLLNGKVSEEASSPEEKQDLENLKALMKIMSTGDSGDTKLDTYFRNRDGLLKDGKITFESVWTLFPPGELVISKPFLNQPQLFLVQSHFSRIWPRVEKDRRRKPPPWVLICWSYDWNGQTFDRRAFEFEIKFFSGTVDIDSLSVFPVKYYKDPTNEGGTWELNLKPELLARGKKFRDVCVSGGGSRMFDYRGDALSIGRGISAQATPDDDLWEHHNLDGQNSVVGDDLDVGKLREVSPKKTQVKGTVMVDFDAYSKHTSTLVTLGLLQPSVRENECGCSACTKNLPLRHKLKFDYDDVNASVPAEKWEETQFLICPPRVIGYSMRESQWAQLQVVELKTATSQGESDTFENKLSLDSATKKIIKDLVDNHEKGKKREGLNANGLDDLIEDKGKGLVLLFHGPPGVGKTLTAESVARSTGKPLFSMGVSDIGVEPMEAERNLTRFFSLATEWKAVMLIDEADVFLNSRGQGETNLDKNALVSVLLRVLEYYQGILILTTNRINSFDIAVQSRVHLAVRYQSFSQKQISDIYTIFLEQIKENGNIDDWNDIRAWIKGESKNSEFNGRQLRNIVSAALGLARAEGKKLQSTHLDEIAQRTRHFHNDLAKQRQAYEAKQLAGGSGER